MLIAPAAKVSKPNVEALPILYPLGSTVIALRCSRPRPAAGANGNRTVNPSLIAPLNAERTAQRTVPSALESERAVEGGSPSLAELNASN
jgi:hypothetical protein